jgi:hypothetical protein
MRRISANPILGQIRANPLHPRHPRSILEAIGI